MNSVKIENGAVLALESIIQESPYMTADIKSNDRGPSWDGSICLYKSDDLRVEDILCGIPIQVKGKNKEEWLNRTGISYPIKYGHLRNYYNDGGVFYIVVVISNNGKKTTVFYNALTTIKLDDLLKGAEDKGADKTKNIPLRKLEKEYAVNLYNVLKQFGKDREMQGSGRGEVVKNAITVKDMDKIDSIKVSSGIATNELEVLRQVTTGEVCLYGHRKDVDMWFPFEQKHQKSMIFKSVLEVNNSIMIDGVEYYNTYRVEGEIEEDSHPIIRVSNNLSIDIGGKSISFDAVDTMESLVKDIAFLKAIQIGRRLVVHTLDVEITDVNLSDVMKKKIQLVQDLNNAFREIGVKCYKKFLEFTKEDWTSLDDLLNLYFRNIRPSNDKSNSWYIWKWEGKEVPLMLNIKENGEMDIVNWFTTTNYALFVDDEKQCQLPRFVTFERDTLIKLYIVPKEIWFKEIERVEYCENNVPHVLQFFIEILSAYDITGNETYFEVAELLSEKILSTMPELDYGVINKLQLVKRKRELSSEEILQLESVVEASDDIMTKCAVNILLDNIGVAKKILSGMKEEDREDFMRFPIYNLLK